MQKSLVTYGHLEKLSAKKNLRAGDLTMVYGKGFLRYIKFGNVEVLRMINHLIRDSNWDTLPMNILNEKIRTFQNGFTIDYEMQCKKDHVDFLWKCHIVGNPNSSIIFKIKGEAKSDFQKNRAGFTVMHPVESCKGKPCRITHSNGEITLSKFPKHIAAKQPFLDIRSMEWSPAPNMKGTILFEGDVFETEDQRNWTDASYKTYCTPLTEPFPKMLAIGDSVEQTVTLSFKVNEPIEITNDKQNHFDVDLANYVRMPKIGTVLNKLQQNNLIVSRLEKLNLDFLRVELKVQEWDPEYLKEVVDIAENMNIKLEIVLFFNGMDANFIRHLFPYKKIISRFILFSLNTKRTNTKIIEEVTPVLREKFPDCKIGAGTDAFFKELNDHRVSTEKIDFLIFSVNPQVHAFDLESLTETLQVQRDVVETCKYFSGGKDVAVGPISLNMRWNPNATETNDSYDDIASFREKLDTRQLSLYGASWLLGSFKNLAESGANSITFFQISGRHGLMSNENDIWPSDLDVPLSCVYPMYLVLKEIMKYGKAKHIVPFHSSNNLVFDGIAFLDRLENTTLLISNYTDETISIQLPMGCGIQLIWILDNSNVLEHISVPEEFPNEKYEKVVYSIVLAPFAIGYYNFIQAST